MGKINSRVKRRFGLSRTKNHYHFLHQGIKKHRPKTFKTEEKAHDYAKLQNLKPEQYYLKKVKKNKKFEVVIYNGKNKAINDKKNNT